MTPLSDIQKGQVFLLSRRDSSEFEQLGKALANLRSQGERIITTNGCFDLLHSGHIQFLEMARSLGDLLVVGLNSDSSVRLIKGADRPLLPQNERAALLGGLRAVDCVIIFDEPLPFNFLEFVQPSVHCKAGDYSAEQLPEKSTVERHGGVIKILPTVPGYSTSSLIQRIIQSVSNADIGITGINDQKTGRDKAFEQLLAGSNLLRQTAYRILDPIMQAVEICSNALLRGNKILVCNDGSSAANAEHFTAELVGRIQAGHPALPAISLASNSAILSAPGDGDDFEQVFARQVQAYGQPGDVLLAIAAGDASPNGIRAVQTARKINMRIISLINETPSQLTDLSDLCLAVPSQSTPLIQQAHLAILLILCDQIEFQFLQKQNFIPND